MSGAAPRPGSAGEAGTQQDLRSLVAGSFHKRIDSVSHIKCALNKQGLGYPELQASALTSMRFRPNLRSCSQGNLKSPRSRVARPHGQPRRGAHPASCWSNDVFVKSWAGIHAVAPPSLGHHFLPVHPFLLLLFLSGGNGPSSR